MQPRLHHTQRFLDIRGSLRKHGRDRRKQLQMKSSQSRDTFQQCNPRHRAEALRIHGGPAHGGYGNARRRCDGVDHDTGQRALAQLAS